MALARTTPTQDRDDGVDAILAETVKRAEPRDALKSCAALTHNVHAPMTGAMLCRRTRRYHVPIAAERQNESALQPVGRPVGDAERGFETAHKRNNAPTNIAKEDKVRDTLFYQPFHPFRMGLRRYGCMQVHT